MASRNTQFPIALPLRGLNTVDPFNLDEGYARELTNFAIKDGRLYHRAGINNLKRNAGLTAAGRKVAFYNPGTFEAYLDNGEVRNLDTGALVATLSATSASARVVSHMGSSLVVGLGTPLVGYTWTTTTFVPVGGMVATDIQSACSHKGRLYVSDLGGRLNYSTVGMLITSGAAMAGNFDLVSILDGDPVAAMFSVSINPSVTTENVLAIFGTKGTVLVYGGDNPGSATWSLIAKYKMPQPMSYDSFYQIDGDVFVACHRYCYWFRDLFTGGAQSAYDNSPTKPIENFYAESAKLNNYTPYAPFAAYPTAAVGYFQPYDAILIRMRDANQFASSSGGDMADFSSEFLTLAYFRQYKAWALWISPPFEGPFIIDSSDSNILYGVSADAQIMQMRFDGNTIPYDVLGASTKYAVEATWKTPYYPAVKSNAHAIKGARVFFQDTIATTPKFYRVRSIFDYSDYNYFYGFTPQTTGTTSYAPVTYFDSAANVIATNTGGTYSPMVGLGGQGGAFSLQFTMVGDTTSGGAGTKYSKNLYAALAYVQEGGEFF